MTVKLILAILFTLGFVASLIKRTGKPWWLLPVALLAAAAVNWLRYFEIVHF
jgi:hypothetical protein